jgi:rubrerythrin
MQKRVSVNEKKRTVAVILSDSQFGKFVGKAKCFKDENTADSFDQENGIKLATARAKVKRFTYKANRQSEFADRLRKLADEYDRSADINRKNAENAKNEVEKVLKEINDFFKPVKAKYISSGLMDALVMGTATDALVYQVPGGMLSNLIAQLKAQNAVDRLDEVLAETPKVRKDLGYPPLVTRMSQIVGVQATANVLSGERYKNVSIEVKAYLKGEYMAIDSYEQLIQRVQDNQLKSQFQNIQQDHKRHAIKVAQRIQNLGARPVGGVGLTGKISEAISSVKYIGKDDNFLLHAAFNGEDKGIQMAEEVVKGDLDKHSTELVSDLLNEDRGHLNNLENLIKN